MGRALQLTKQPTDQCYHQTRLLVGLTERGFEAQLAIPGEEPLDVTSSILVVGALIAAYTGRPKVTVELNLQLADRSLADRDAKGAIEALTSVGSWRHQLEDQEGAALAYERALELCREGFQPDARSTQDRVREVLCPRTRRGPGRGSRSGFCA